jgi:hypothetical protein
MTDIDNLLNFAYPLCLEIPRQKKHVSLVIVKNRIISIGRNYFKTHPKAHKLGYLYNEMHSELVELDQFFEKAAYYVIKATPALNSFSSNLIHTNMNYKIKYIHYKKLVY